MEKKELRATRFEARIRKTHQRFGHISLDAIVGSYFGYRKPTTDFTSIVRPELASFGEYTPNISTPRLEQMLAALNKANEVKKLRRNAA